MTTARSYRECLIDVISTLASGEAFLEYEAKVPIAYVPDEIVCQFFDDHYHPKSAEFIAEFSEDELKEIGIFSGFLQMGSDAVDEAGSPDVAACLKLPDWRRMMKRAKMLATLLETKQGEQVSGGNGGQRP
jgi:hypothetical protein